MAAVNRVKTRSATIGEAIDSRRIADLPLNGRDPLSLQLPMAGTGKRDQQQYETISVNGSTTNSMVAAIRTRSSKRPRPPPIRTRLQEFRIETNGSGAHKGRNYGAFVSTVEKSGTNQFRGTPFEYFRNEKLNTRDSFANSIAPFKHNQHGGTLGGPAAKRATVLFSVLSEDEGANEPARQRRSRARSRTVVNPHTVKSLPLPRRTSAVCKQSLRRGRPGQISARYRNPRTCLRNSRRYLHQRHKPSATQTGLSSDKTTQDLMGCLTSVRLCLPGRPRAERVCAEPSLLSAWYIRWLAPLAVCFRTGRRVQSLWLARDLRLARKPCLLMPRRRFSGSIRIRMYQYSSRWISG